MEFTNDFFIAAQGVIERVFRGRRRELIEASGNIATELKSDNTVVTELDKSVEAELRKELLEFDKSIGIEGEEYGVEGNRKTFWLIDPIDGTNSFVRGLPDFRNMATLVDSGEAVFTVIYKPVQDEVFVAAKGEGAFRNGLPIKVSDRPLEHAHIEIHAPGRRHDQWTVMEELAQNVGSIRRAGEFVTVAEGKIDGLLVYKGRGGPWDFAPRSLIIAEAGGRVANLGSDTYDYTDSSFIATNPVIFDDVMRIVMDSVK